MSYTYDVTRFLLVKFDYVTPEMRFFIAGLLLDFYSVGEFIVPAKELSGRYGVTLNTVNKTLKYLVQSGYAERSNYSLKKGRPIGKYVFTAALKKKFVEAPKWMDAVRPTKFWGKAIIKVVGGSNCGDSKTKYTVSNRYLICLLALFANDLGVIDSIPASRIAKILGFSPLRMRSQLTTLVEGQVLQSYIGGVTGKYLFGKVPGIYFLNTETIAKALGLSLEALSFRKVDQGVLAHNGDRYFAKRLYRLARALDVPKSQRDKELIEREEKYLKDWWPSYSPEHFIKVCRFFSDQDVTRVPDYLQIKLERYIANYLTIASLSDQKNQETELDKLKNKIAEECIPAKWRMDENEKNAFADESSFKLLVESILSIVQNVASEYTDYFQLEEHRNTSFRILSYEEGFTIEAFKPLSTDGLK